MQLNAHGDSCEDSQNCTERKKIFQNIRGLGVAVSLMDDWNV